jgi:uncharacterized protein DUF4154
MRTGLHRSGAPKKKWNVAPVLLLIAVCCCRCQAQQASVPEPQIKAAFLLNFAKFVTWPDTRSADAFTICSLGKAEVVDSLEKMVQAREIGGRKILLRFISTPSELSACAVLFVNRKDTQQAIPLLRTAASSPILSVGEADGFISSGGMVNFVVEDNHVRFQINPSAAEKAGLKISSKLLAIAQVIGPDSAHGGMGK